MLGSPLNPVDVLLTERARAYATGAHTAVGQRHKREKFPYTVHLQCKPLSIR
jgi:hypothetical protein